MTATVARVAGAIREALDDVTLTDDALARAARAALAAAGEPEPVTRPSSSQAGLASLRAGYLAPFGQVIR